MPTLSPGWIVKEIFFSTSNSPSGYAEGQIAELNAALGVFEVRHTGAVGHINGCVQQLGDAVEGALPRESFR